MPAEAYPDSIHVAAKPERVFDYFTQPDAVLRWLGERVSIDPRPGGEFTLFFGSESVQGPSRQSV